MISAKDQTTAWLKAQKALQRRGGKLTPIHRHISKECGLWTISHARSGRTYSQTEIPDFCHTPRQFDNEIGYRCECGEVVWHEPGTSKMWDEVWG